MPKLGRRSEPQQVQYGYYNSTLSTSNAPFGTEYTPYITSRIVGSKMVPCLERRANPFFHDHQGDQGGVTPRFVPRLEYPVAEKPNNMDPHILTDYVHKLHSVNQDFLGPKPTTYGKLYPETKDLARRYSPLPPIDRNKTKNESSTVFEPEAWTRQYRENKENRDRMYYMPDNRGNAVNYPNNGPVDSQYHDDRGQERTNMYESNKINSNGYMHDGDVYNGDLRSYPRNTQYNGDGGSNGLVANGYQSPNLYDPPPHHRKDNFYETSQHRQGSRQDERGRTPLDKQKQLLNMLPSDCFLPEYPLSLSREDEEALLMMVKAELGGVEPRLKDAYLDITENYDRALCGWCHYRNLFFALSNAKISLSPNLQRLISALFVSPQKLQEVNYEKFLSFIGSAVNSSIQGRASRPSSPLADNQFSKLRNVTEQQLHNEPIDFERLVARFQEVDREVRGSLSANQIKDVLKHQNVVLQDSVVNMILSKCTDRNEDGQYVWEKVVNFLEKAHPAKTGLPIPRSKRPLEYAKKVPSPVPDWPHAASSSPMPPEQVTPLWKKDDHPYGTSYGYMNEDKRDAYEMEQEQVKTNREIERMDKELKQLEAGYEVMKQKLHSSGDESPWFKKFMEFANALYKLDTTNTGRLPPEDVREWTNWYNASYKLNIPDYVITRALGDNAGGGGVNLHAYLTQLGCQDW